MNCRLKEIMDMKQKNKLDTPLNVLYLEDNPKDAEVCRELIIDAGYNLDIDITATEKEFESFLLFHKYDIILSDFNLPGFDAFGALRLCEKICPEVPFICVSGTIGEVTAVELLKLGAVDYVLKDRLERLPFAIKRAIDDAKDRESRQKAEKLLAASEVQYRRLFESAKDGILILDAESGKIVDVNPFLIQLLGYSKEEFLEKEIWEIGFFKNIVANKDKFMELQQKKYVRYENLPLETSDGRKINVEFISNVYSVNSRDVIQCNIRDITERKKIELELLSSESRYRSFFENSMDSILLTSPDGKIFSANPAACKLFGYTEEEFIKLDRSGVIDSTDPRLPILLSERELKGKAKGELTLIRKNGSQFPADISSAIFKSQEGLDRSSMIIRDITEQKVIQNRLKFNSELLSRIGQSVIATDLQGNVIYWNHGAEQIYGWSSAEVMGQNIIVLTPAEQTKEQAIEIMKALSEGNSWSGEFLVKRKDGSNFPAQVTDAPIIDSDGKLIGIIGISSDITERKRAEEELNKFFNLVPVMVCVAHIDGRFIKINAEWEKVLNFTEKEILEMSFLDLIHPDDREATMKEVTKQIEGGSTFNFINRYRCKDRSYKWLEWAASPAEHKTVLYAAARDITDRKRAEQELLKLSRATEQSPASIIITDTEGNIEYINKKVTEISGYRSEEVIGKNPRIFTSGEKTKIEYKTLWDTIASGKEWRGEFHNKKKNGELYWEFASISPILNREGVITNFLAVKEDITQSKKDQSEISRMANILEATPDLVGMAYPNGDVFYLNRGGRLLMQIPASEDITKLNIREFHPEEISLLITQKGLPIAKDRGYWSAETRILTRTGEEIPVLQNIISHKNYENVVTHYSTIIRDIREIKKMEENLKEAKEKAEQSDKLKTEFLAQMSHEIRSPMNAVISFATLLKEDLSKDLSPEHLEYFAGIDSAGRRLIRTVELILNASELQVGTYKPDFSDMGLIGEILTRISSEYKLLAEEKGLTFNFRSNIEEAVIEGDKESIYQVFVNLMDNAVKYTQKGSVSINVEKNEDAQEVKVTIEDSGIGISQEFLDQMFEPFTQEDRGYSRRYEGNGLGLSLVKKYCELNGITIQVKSKKGIGTKFELIFSSIE